MKARVDQILDLLVEEIEERLKRRSWPPARPAVPTPVQADVPPTAKAQPPRHQPEPEPPPLPPGPPPARLIGRLALGLAALVVVVNIPINRYGITLGTAMPDPCPRPGANT